MKKLLTLVLFSLLCGQVLAKESYLYEGLPDQWKNKEITSYTARNPIFASEDVYFHLLAKHYLAKDLTDYELAEHLAAYLPKYKDYASISNSLRQRKYLRENVLPILDTWSKKHSSFSDFPEYISLDIPQKYNRNTVIEKKLEIWVGYTYDPANRNQLSESAEGRIHSNSFGISHTARNNKYADQGIEPTCTANVKIKLQDNFFIKPKINVSTKQNSALRRFTIGNNVRNCFLKHKATSEDQAIDILDKLEKGHIFSWIVKLDINSYASKYLKNIKNGAYEQFIETSLDAVVEGFIIYEPSGKVIFSSLSEGNVLSKENSGKNVEKIIKKVENTQAKTNHVGKLNLTCDISINDKGSFFSGQHYIGIQKMTNLPSNTNELIAKQVRSEGFPLEIIESGSSNVIHAKQWASEKRTRGYDYIITVNKTDIEITFKTPMGVIIDKKDVKTTFCNTIENI